MRGLKGGSRFIGSSRKFDGVRGLVASGVLVDRLPPSYWDSKDDPEWIAKLDASCGGATMCVKESMLVGFKITSYPATAIA